MLMMMIIMYDDDNEDDEDDDEDWEEADVDDDGGDDDDGDGDDGDDERDRKLKSRLYMYLSDFLFIIIIWSLIKRKLMRHMRRRLKQVSEAHICRSQRKAWAQISVTDSFLGFLPLCWTRCSA